ncbi:DUF481 domain-containing protein [Parvularcula sp. LCG005]|uniref:DUF481 domain-containing protein n=1 Tax=Parvularcula sp. LCG005 TaxID=3078805 RepID=UPI0029436833|nr:DUF481 domain-containing protein [Parvularcula sp. LCG005]WOI53871.1 DUF481 domain-containing protein [Parvularcula sp. LCG005]
MMDLMTMSLLGVVGTFAVEPLAADDKGKENWDGSVEFSAASASGNTENTVLGLKLDARRVLGRYTHDVAAGANYAESTTRDDDGEDVSAVTQDNWFARYRMEIQTGDRTFIYGRARYEQDSFSGFESRAFLGAGLGHSLIENDRTTWDVLAGPGVQYTVLETPEGPVPEDFEDSETEFALYAGSDLNWTLRENVAIEHDLDVTYSEENTTLSTEAAIKTKLTEALSSRLSYKVTHETDPPVGREATDSLLRASIALGF